jgi:hypothetical protein
VFFSNKLGNSRQMDLFGLGIDVKLKERKKEDEHRQVDLKIVGQWMETELIGKDETLLSILR